MTDPVMSKNLVDAINLCIDSKISSYSFITFAKITAINNNYTIDVKPLSKNRITNKKINTSEYAGYPEIKGIPYLYIAQPIINENCILLHLDGNVTNGDNTQIIDGVKYVKGSVKPHSLNNCVAICGFKNIYDNLDATEEDEAAAGTQLGNIMYPVGAIYISIEPTSPAELFGGTWAEFGQGRVLVGVGSGTDSAGNTQTFSVMDMGGEYKHTLSINEMPAHAHPTTTTNGNYAKQTVNRLSNINTQTGTHTVTHYKYSVPIQYGSVSSIGSYTESKTGRIAGPDDPYIEQADRYDEYYPTADYGVPKQGGGQSHNNIQPYYAVYMWTRIE